jgi:hypothetical protein
MEPPLEQRRASAAAHRIRTWLEKYDDPKLKEFFWRGYCGAADQFPGDIRYAGLLRALATALKNTETPSSDLEKQGRRAAVSDLAYWFREFQYLVSGGTDDSLTEIEQIDAKPEFLEQAQRLLNDLIESNPRELQILQHESGEFLAWLKLLAAPNRPRERQSGGQSEGETEQDESADTTEVAE